MCLSPFVEMNILLLLPYEIDWEMQNSGARRDGMYATCMQKLGAWALFGKRLCI